MFLIAGQDKKNRQFFDTPVIVPRDYTERPQSVEANCSYMLNVNTDQNFEGSWNWIKKIENKELQMDISWLGNGDTSELVINILKKFLE